MPLKRRTETSQANLGHIHRGHLAEIKVLIPQHIGQLINNRINSLTLATLRATLLPKLLNGELSVTKYEKEVPA